MESPEATRFWQSIAELDWSDDAQNMVVAKVPISPTRFLTLRSRIARQPAFDLHLSVAGGLLWVAIDPQWVTKFSEQLAALNLCGLVIRAPAETDWPVESIWLGRRQGGWMNAAIKKAMDPTDRFPGFGNTDQPPP
jgi:hypothetical protein